MRDTNVKTEFGKAGVLVITVGVVTLYKKGVGSISLSKKGDEKNK